MRTPKRLSERSKSTSTSWLNMVERFFRRITTDRLERGVFRGVSELIAAIEEYVCFAQLRSEALRLDGQGH